jgi:hypothetical protein
MSDWIPFGEGRYRVEQAFLIAPNLHAAVLEKAFIEVYLDRRQRLQLKGRGFVYNILVVQMLEDTDEIDLILDLGGDYKYILKNPKLDAGKVFSPRIKSTLQFSPGTPWEQMPQKEFENLASRLKLLSV